MMKTKLNTNLLLGLIFLTSLLGCTSDNPDEGTSAQFKDISGLVIDGYVSGARVYADFNENYRRDAGEPKTVSDANGYFTDNLDQSIDYCASDASSSEARHCLEGDYEEGEHLLSASGGFDLITNETFLGELFAKAEVLDNQNISDQIISPLTSIVSHLSDADRDLLLAEYSLVAGDQLVDYLDADNVDSFFYLRVKAALSFHKVATLLAQPLDNQYTQLGTNDSLPQSAFSSMYQALAQQILDNGPLAASTIDDAFDAAEANIRSLYSAAGITLPEALTSSSVRSDAITNSTKVLTVIDALITTTLSMSNVNDRIMAIELVTIKALNGESTAEIDATVTLASDVDSDLYANLLDSNNEIDFIGLRKESVLSSPDFSQFEITNAQSLLSIPGKQLFIENNAGGTVTGQAILSFEGEQGASLGQVSMCLSFDDTSGDLSTETTGTNLSGNWVAIDERRIVFSFSNALNLLLVSTGLLNEGAGANQRDVFRFNYGGDSDSWISEDGLINSTEGLDHPSDSSECSLLLDSIPSIKPS